MWNRTPANSNQTNSIAKISQLQKLLYTRENETELLYAMLVMMIDKYQSSYEYVDHVIGCLERGELDS